MVKANHLHPANLGSTPTGTQQTQVQLPLAPSKPRFNSHWHLANLASTPTCTQQTQVQLPLAPSKPGFNSHWLVANLGSTLTCTQQTQVQLPLAPMQVISRTGRASGRNCSRAPLKVLLFWYASPSREKEK